MLSNRRNLASDAFLSSVLVSLHDTLRALDALLTYRPFVSQRQVALGRLCLESFSLGRLFKASARSLGRLW
eukprot:scaffold7374_cov211-Pinguiococcus_pyrenoidosus.AAC.2